MCFIYIIFWRIELIYGGTNLGIKCGNLNVKDIYFLVYPICLCCAKM